MLSARSWFLRADRALESALASEVWAPEKAKSSETHGPTESASIHMTCRSLLLIVMSSTSCWSTNTLQAPMSSSISCKIREGAPCASMRQ